MGRKLPPMAAVRAFEAAARNLSFKAAAEELCLSPSAVSHQVKALEEFLDTALFERDGNRMRLTLTGEAYAGKLTGLLDAFDESTQEARGVRKGETLRVLSTPGFAARWLVPRLERFAYGDRLRLGVSVGAPSTDFATNDADVVIQWADGDVSGCSVEPFMKSGRYPVISPALKAAKGVERPEDLTSLTLMHDETMDMWGDWFRAAGVEPPEFPRGPRFPNCELATTAAEQGQGVALAYDLMVRGTLESGRLIRLFDTVTIPFVIYSFVCQKTRRDEPMIAAFREWIFSEMESEGRAVLADAAE